MGSLPNSRGLTWQEIGVEARRRRDALIPAEHRLSSELLKSIANVTDVTNVHESTCLFTPSQLEIISSIAETIVAKVAKSVWTALEVAEAFCLSASVAQQLTNCITQPMYAEALQQAKYLDDYLLKHGKVIGPLHGLPVSLKDNIITPPFPSCAGYVDWALETTENWPEAPVVTHLKSLGAIPYVKTAVPTAMMMPETRNNVYADTLNPHNRKLSSGGSSGGEGALIAMRGSPLGVGTDIGGSIRIPSAWNNLFGLRPSAGRFSHTGFRNVFEGQEAVKVVQGPISRDLSSLKLYSKALVDSEMWLSDATLLPIPWRTVNLLPNNELCFAFHKYDKVVRCHPPIERGVDIVVDALRKADVTMIDWEPKLHAQAWSILRPLFRADGGKEVTSRIEATGEPWFPYMHDYRDAARAGNDLPTSQTWKLQAQQTKLAQEYLDMWNATAKATPTGRPIDAIIAPVSAWAAAAHGKCLYTGYTGVWNLLDYSTCVVPVTWADKTIDTKSKEYLDYTPVDERDRKVWEEYDPEVYHHGPVAIQIITRKLEEEKALALAEVVVRALGGTVPKTSFE
ncbi:amidase signature domain-containing protein [Aspergillus cavernicola]|uniref:amidase n=1 Tax=Aspergillus cavernicola TaxID=176166 RepID=A0ABR4HAR2_9EURO